MNHSKPPCRKGAAARNQDKTTELDSLWKDFAINSEHFLAIWRSFTQTFIVAITGILAALFVGYQYKEAQGVISVFLPLVIIAWHVMMELQNQELYSRSRYFSLLETRIRSLTGIVFPCWESRFRRIIYHSGRYDKHQPLVAFPILLLYGLCVYNACLHLREWHYLLVVPFLFLYLCLPVISTRAASAYRREIDQDLEELGIIMNIDENGL